MLLNPRATEKTYREQTKRTYVFEVKSKDEAISKQSIAKAVKEQFNVNPISVRVLTRKGKPTRFSRGKHAYPGTTYRQDKKFAYVTLKDGESIKIFQEEEEAPVEAPKETKATEKKDDKKSAKSTKNDKKGDK